LAISYSKLGETHASLGDLNKALPFYEDFNRLGEELYASSPSNVGFKNGLAISYYKLGTMYEKRDKQQAISYCKKAEVLLQELVRDAPKYREYQKNLKIVQRILKRLGGV
jgi:tetratricopeptide (TPR) repeat protein